MIGRKIPSVCYFLYYPYRKKTSFIQPSVIKSVLFVIEETSRNAEVLSILYRHSFPEAMQANLK